MTEVPAYPGDPEPQRMYVQGVYVQCPHCRLPCPGLGEWNGGSVTVSKRGPDGTVRITPHAIGCTPETREPCTFCLNPGPASSAGIECSCPTPCGAPFCWWAENSDDTSARGSSQVSSAPVLEEEPTTDG